MLNFYVPMCFNNDLKVITRTPTRGRFKDPLADVRGVTHNVEADNDFFFRKVSKLSTLNSELYYFCIMTTALHTYLSTQSSLTPEEITRIVSLASPRHVRRNENVLTSGDVCREKIFVGSGMLRIFSVTSDGSEHIVQFAAENNWAVDAESYDKQTPSKVNIGAVEPSEIFVWSRADFENLRNTIPSLKRFAEQIISTNVYYSRQRILTSISATPEEKYDEFVKMFPGYLARLPLRMIASYLGMSIKTLTRIRQADVLKS